MKWRRVICEMFDLDPSFCCNLLLGVLKRNRRVFLLVCKKTLFVTYLLVFFLIIFLLRWHYYDDAMANFLRWFKVIIWIFILKYVYWIFLTNAIFTCYDSDDVVIDNDFWPIPCSLGFWKTHTWVDPNTSLSLWCNSTWD